MRLANQSPQQFHPPAGTAGEVVLYRRAVRKRAYDQPAQVPALTRVDGTGVAVRRVDHPLVLVHRARVLEDLAVVGAHVSTSEA